MWTERNREKHGQGRMSGGGKAVCVTGASGYIASWLVKVLLHRGYTVRATVRDTDDPKRTHHLLKLDGAEERLQLFKADLVEEGSFDSAVDGCDGVFHTASPVIVENVKEPQAELIGPALRGTINVLKSCAKVASIKRVVLTSSVAAVAFTGKPTNPDDIIDETWFSNSDFCEASKLWYHLSKTLAEEAAWKFSKENGIDLVVINPVYVIGPPLQPTINYTVKIILDLLGAPTYPNGTFQYVDVRDVANAHIQAFEVPSASGRYCLLEGAAHFSEIVKTIRQLFPHLQLPEKCVDDDSYPACNVSKEKAKSLGIEFIPLEVSLRDTIESLIEKNCISF